MSITLAPFETLAEHGQRERSEEPYNEDFINRCREKAQEYAQLDGILRPSLLSDLRKCVPRHFWTRVFE